jgi:hypothetical protein
MEQHNITRRGIALDITFTPEKFGLVDHIEIRAEGRTLLPVTQTGYYSHFITAGTVADHSGVVAFLTAWLEHEAARTAWSGAQLSLFQVRKFRGWPAGQSLNAQRPISTQKLHPTRR